MKNPESDAQSTMTSLTASPNAPSNSGSLSQGHAIPSNPPSEKSRQGKHMPIPNSGLLSNQLLSPATMAACVIWPKRGRILVFEGKRLGMKGILPYLRLDTTRHPDTAHVYLPDSSLWAYQDQSQTQLSVPIRFDTTKRHLL